MVIARWLLRSIDGCAEEKGCWGEVVPGGGLRLDCLYPGFPLMVFLNPASNSADFSLFILSSLNSSLLIRESLSPITNLRF